MEEKLQCPICDEPDVKKEDASGSPQKVEYDCPSCGRFVLKSITAENLRRLMDTRAENRALLTHAVYRMQQQGTPILDPELIERLLDAALPSLMQQKESLILFLVHESPLGKIKVFESGRIRSAIGAISTSIVNNMIEQFWEDGLIWREWSPVGDPRAKISLKFKGWEYHDQVSRGKSESRTAFMAMNFGNPELNSFVEKVFKPAVKLTGFDLIRADDIPTAGLIDDHIRVLIRSARFVIADLTYDNPGSYWEAGFGEGLGKPVIYTCEKKKFESKQSHFDTNHCHTVMWESSHPEAASRDLKATIRATLPADAILTDPQFARVMP